MKDIMNKILFCSILLSLSFLVGSCSDDDKATPPSAPVTDLTADAGYGDIMLKWKNPTDPNFLYVDINFVDSKGVERSKKVTKFAVDQDGYVKDTITGFTNTESYTFTLTSCSGEGARGPSAEVSHKPNTPAFDLVINTVTLEPDFGGAKVIWTNETEKNATIRVKYKDAKTGALTSTVLNANKTGYGFVSGLDDKLREFKVDIEDANYDVSESKTFEITPMLEVEIPKDKWTIPGYDRTSSGGQIGYSSQQLSGEGGYPGGHVMAIIDGSISTYWHARYSDGGSSYPHFIIVDLGKDITISRVEVQRRQGDKRGQTGHEFITCTDANAVNKSDTTTWKWEHQGHFPFDATKNEAQSFRLENNPKAKYLKIFMGGKDKGENDYAMISEVYVYGRVD